MNYWLIKSEPDCFSIDDLKKKGVEPWSGVRNFQARNYMRDGMKVGDLALFYHSSTNPNGVYGIAKVASKPHLDATAKDPKDEHYEPKSEWVCVDMKFVKKLAHPVTLEEIKRDEKLKGILVAKTGQRLSVMPVEEKHYKRIIEMAASK
jgi:predicted RNA-binding protein with PUA-like domain